MYGLEFPKKVREDIILVFGDVEVLTTTNEKQHKQLWSGVFSFVQVSEVRRRGSIIYTFVPVGGGSASLIRVVLQLCD